jgi:hypothetical protein
MLLKGVLAGQQERDASTSSVDFNSAPIKKRAQHGGRPRVPEIYILTGQGGKNEWALIPGRCPGLLEIALTGQWNHDASPASLEFNLKMAPTGQTKYV